MAWFNHPTRYSMHQKFSRGFDCASWRLQAVPLAKDCFNSISGALESIRRFGGSKPPGFKKAHLRDPKCMIQFGNKPTVIMGNKEANSCETSTMDNKRCFFFEGSRFWSKNPRLPGCYIWVVQQKFPKALQVYINRGRSSEYVMISDWVPK